MKDQPTRTPFPLDTMRQISLFVLLVALGATVRVQLQDLPNFAPVAALALFAGYVFRSRLLAAAVPVSIMTISDSFIGGYDWAMMALVYGSLTVPVLFRSLLRRYFAIDGRSVGSVLRPVAGLLGASLAGSLLFFLVTNFGCWLWFDMYDSSFHGLLECYLRAVPFFRYTLAGDLFFGILLFGGFGLAVLMNWAASVQPAQAGEGA